MSLLSNLSPNKGSVKSRKRIGRGIGSGRGGTSTKGHKGQKARAGGSIIRGFEGGQMPLARRLPKFGFTNAPFKKTYEIVNLKDLKDMSGEINVETLKSAGLIKKGPFKVLGEGKISSALNIKANKFSASAKSAIEAAGGTAEVI